MEALIDNNISNADLYSAIEAVFVAGAYGHVSAPFMVDEQLTWVQRIGSYLGAPPLYVFFVVKENGDLIEILKVSIAGEALQ